jgi:hypothetical protein
MIGNRMTAGKAEIRAMSLPMVGTPISSVSPMAARQYSGTSVVKTQKAVLRAAIIPRLSAPRSG